jgi:K+-transporting ATPase KdpF subunit
MWFSQMVEGPNNHAWHRFHHCNCAVFRNCSSVRSRVRTLETGETGMSLGNAILLFISVLMCGYLLYALLKAEEF